MKELTPAAEKKALAKVAKEKNFSVIDGRLAVDYSDPVQRRAVVDQLVPELVKAINSGDTGDVKADTSASDTSFLEGADPRLTKPFLQGFNTSVVTIYWVGLGVMLLAFVITWLFRVPPLRTRSALEERTAAAAAAAAAEAEVAGTGGDTASAGDGGLDGGRSPDGDGGSGRNRVSAGDDPNTEVGADVGSVAGGDSGATASLDGSPGRPESLRRSAASGENGSDGLAERRGQ